MVAVLKDYMTALFFYLLYVKPWFLLPEAAVLGVSGAASVEVWPDVLVPRLQLTRAPHQPALHLCTMEKLRGGRDQAVVINPFVTFTGHL